MPGIDASIPLGAKAPDQMQSLSGMLGIANGMQTLQQNQQKTQQGGIDLQERQAMQQVMADPSNYANDDGSFNLQKAQSAIMRAAPTTGAKYIQDIATAHQQGIQAQRFLGQLTDENRTRIGQGIASAIDSPPEVMGQTLDAIGKQYKSIGGQDVADSVKNKYFQILKSQGPEAAKQYALQTSRSVLPQETQQTMNTPTVVPVNNNQQTYGVNVKPQVPGMPIGSVVPGTTAQMQLPPNTPTVAPGTNQPGYLGPQPPAQPQPGQPQGAGPRPQPGVNGAFTGNPDVVAQAIGAIKDPQERANAQAAFESQMRATNGQLPPHGFVPSGPVPGANESKGGTVQVMNDHWARINAGAADAPVANALLTTIKQLAPNAITGAEAGKRAYWNGLFNVLIPGTQASGDLQKDTDLLNKAMAQLNLSTPATTDAMRTLIEAGRPHSTMSSGAINEAVGQIQGQLKANMAVRNLLAPDKQYADSTGDPTHYTEKRQTLESLADPRIFQYASMPKGKERTDFLNRQTDAADLRKKAAVLEKMGAFQ